MFLAFSRDVEPVPGVVADPPGSDPIAAERLGTAAFVLSLRERGVVSTSVLRAMETVPRHVFAPRRFGDLARSDVALPLACGQTMTAPATVAAMLAALDVRPGHRVLEVGAGTGYVSALLARIGARVVTTERHPVLAEGAAGRLATLVHTGSVELRCCDGLAEPGAEARYDRILLNGSVVRVPPGLTSRLAGSGRLVAALATEAGPRLLSVGRDADGQLHRHLGTGLRIAPLREAENLGGAATCATES